MGDTVLVDAVAKFLSEKLFERRLFNNAISRRSSLTGLNNIE